VRGNSARGGPQGFRLIEHSIPPGRASERTCQLCGLAGHEKAIRCAGPSKSRTPARRRASQKRRGRLNDHRYAPRPFPVSIFSSFSSRTRARALSLLCRSTLHNQPTLRTPPPRHSQQHLKDHTTINALPLQLPIQIHSIHASLVRMHTCHPGSCTGATTRPSTRDMRSRTAAEAATCRRPRQHNASPRLTNMRPTTCILRLRSILTISARSVSADDSDAEAVWLGRGRRLTVAECLALLRPLMLEFVAIGKDWGGGYHCACAEISPTVRQDRNPYLRRCVA
jgi:hypothetical protein